MVERIKSLISHLGVSTRAFAISCGLRQNTLSNQLNGMRDLSLSTILAIIAAYPDVSTEWLLRGNGEMLRAELPDANADRVLKMVDTIATLQDTINAKTDTIATLNERIKQLESQLNTK